LVYAADICFGLVLMVVQKETSVLETQQVTFFVEVTFNFFVFWISNNTKLNKYKFVFNHYYLFSIDSEARY